MLYVKVADGREKAAHAYFVGATFDEIVAVAATMGYYGKPNQVVAEIVTDSDEVIRAAEKTTHLVPTGPQLLKLGVAAVRSGTSRTFFLFTA